MNPKRSLSGPEGTCINMDFNNITLKGCFLKMWFLSNTGTKNNNSIVQTPNISILNYILETLCHFYVVLCHSSEINDNKDEK